MEHHASTRTRCRMHFSAIRIPKFRYSKPSTARTFRGLPTLPPTFDHFESSKLILPVLNYQTKKPTEIHQTWRLSVIDWKKTLKKKHRWNFTRFWRKLTPHSRSSSHTNTNFVPLWLLHKFFFQPGKTIITISCSVTWKFFSWNIRIYNSSNNNMYPHLWNSFSGR